MKGLELAEKYFYEYGLPMIDREFPQEKGKMAFGLVGPGSECFGFDDQFSQDHDFGPSFSIWISKEDYRRFGKDLERAYANLPDKAFGFKRPSLMDQASNGRHGVQIIEDFYFNYLGTFPQPQSDLEWLKIPEHFLATATNGKVFADYAGDFSRIRQSLLDFYPEEVVKKKLAAYLIQMGQAGQYNYPRSLKRGDPGAIYSSAACFIEASSGALFLLFNRYRPFYKWWYRSLSNIEVCPKEVVEDLTLLMEDPKDHRSIEAIERICQYVRFLIANRGWPVGREDFLTESAQILYGSIQNPDLRALSIFEGGERLA